MRNVDSSKQSKIFLAMVVTKEATIAMNAVSNVGIAINLSLLRNLDRVHKAERVLYASHARILRVQNVGRNLSNLMKSGKRKTGATSRIVLGINANILCARIPVAELQGHRNGAGAKRNIFSMISGRTTRCPTGDATNTNNRSRNHPTINLSRAPDGVHGRTKVAHPWPYWLKPSSNSSRAQSAEQRLTCIVLLPLVDALFRLRKPIGCGKGPFSRTIGRTAADMYSLVASGRCSFSITEANRLRQEAVERYKDSMG